MTPAIDVPSTPATAAQPIQRYEPAPFVAEPDPIDPKAVYDHRVAALALASNLASEFHALTDPGERRKFALEHRGDAQKFRQFTESTAPRFAFLTRQYRRFSATAAATPELRDLIALRDATRELELTINRMLSDATVRPIALDNRQRVIRRTLKQLKAIDTGDHHVAKAVEALNAELARIDAVLADGDLQAMIALAVALGLEQPAELPSFGGKAKDNFVKGPKPLPMTDGERPARPAWSPSPPHVAAGGHRVRPPK